MTAGEARISSKVNLVGIALIWMTAQILVVVIHFWISSGTSRNTSREWCCDVDFCEVPAAFVNIGIRYARK
jgi:hypothetical protein